MMKFCLGTQDDCENYVRVMSKLSTGEYFVCGTNAFRPLCRIYSYRLVSLESHIQYIHTQSRPSHAESPHLQQSLL